MGVSGSVGVQGRLHRRMNVYLKQGMYALRVGQEPPVCLHHCYWALQHCFTQTLIHVSIVGHVRGIVCSL